MGGFLDNSTPFDPKIQHHIEDALQQAAALRLSSGLKHPAASCREFSIL